MDKVGCLVVQAELLVARLEVLVPFVDINGVKQKDTG